MLQCICWHDSHDLHGLHVPTFLPWCLALRSKGEVRMRRCTPDSASRPQMWRPQSTSPKNGKKKKNKTSKHRGTWKVRELQSQRTQTCFSWHFLHSHRPRVRTPMVKSKNMMRTFRICEALAACPRLLPMIHTCLPASRTSKRCKKMLVNARNFSQLCALPEVKQEFMQGTNPLHQSHPHQNRAPKMHLQWDYHHLVLLPAF